MNYKIEQYQPRHKTEIINVWEKSVIATHHFLSEKDFQEIKHMLQNFDFDQLHTSCLTLNNKVIGFLALKDKKIEMLFLDPEYIGKKLGYRLLHYAVSTFKANAVDVNEQNDHARKFYESFGFQIEERTEQDDLGKNYPLLRMKIHR